MNRRTYPNFLGILLPSMLAVLAANADEFRKPRAISTPENIGAQELGPVIRPVSRERIEAAVNETFRRYNTPEFREILADEFFDGFRLADAILEKIPRDATLRVLAIGNIQTFGQRLRSIARSSDQILTSVVSVTVRAQIESTSIDGQFVRTEGTSELILHIHEEIRDE